MGLAFWEIKGITYWIKSAQGWRGKSAHLGWNCVHSPFVPQQHIINPVRKALDYYTEMEKALEREKQNRAQSENAAKSKETAVGTQSKADSQTGVGPEAPKAGAQWPVVDGTVKNLSKDGVTLYWFKCIWAI